MTSPGGDAMTSDFHREADLARLKREKLPRPVAWRIRQSEVTRLTAEGGHCETRKCSGRVAVVTMRWWRSTEAARILLAEHLVCSWHGAEFAGRHRVDIDPAGEVGVRRLGDAERAVLWVNGRHCDWPWPACQIAATWCFMERYTLRGEPRADEHLSCDRHARAFAERFHVAIPSGEGGSR